MTTHQELLVSDSHCALLDREGPIQVPLGLEYDMLLHAETNCLPNDSVPTKMEVGSAKSKALPFPAPRSYLP